MSREYRGSRIVIYPQYIDSNRSRSEGRRVSLKYAVPNPRVDEIIRAAELIGLKPIVENKKYSREWWGSSQRIVVNKKGSKLKTLVEIALKIKEYRQKTS
ncbi:MAG: signal recognition particle protein Srp19 [Desulfurococcaceae archaeon]|uniref:Signal recognition particle 19 kDa protein n=1 Tax=Staphylothermus marinus TaxID=2280 RepID=A0A7C4D655_STAMA